MPLEVSNPPKSIDTKQYQLYLGSSRRYVQVETKMWK